ncbi:MAG: bifunctional nuclease family protein [Candidatus Obscuribacterales bacterium]|jgi:bifunctional DNase/RNase|nr:bifunctional nuclease family protein [Candidatus Obscuribacterales bacterium]
MIEMQVVGLFLDASSGAPIVVLNDSEHKIALPIWIGMSEARAIGLAVNNTVSIRPLTHDLYLDTIKKLGYCIKEVQINGIVSDAYRATLILVADGQEYRSIEIDARPSDAIALSTATGAKLFVSEEILQQMGIQQSNIKIKERTESSKADLERLLELSDSKESEEQFKTFLKDLKASDFKLPGDTSSGETDLNA